jgi:hypothetical protein
MSTWARNTKNARKKQVLAAQRFDIEDALRTAFDVANRGVGYQLNLLSDPNLVRLMGTDWRPTLEGHDFLKAATPIAVGTI